MGEPARPGHALDHEAPSAGSSIAADATRATYRCDRRDDCAQMNLRIGDSRGHGGFMCDRIYQPLMMRTVYEDKNRQEAMIRDSGLDWIIVRPTMLTDWAAIGKVTATVNLTNVHGGKIPRADVAHFVIEQTADDQWVRKTPLIASA